MGLRNRTDAKDVPSVTEKPYFAVLYSHPEYVGACEESSW